MQQSSLFAPGPGRVLLVAGSLGMFALGAAQALYGPFFPYFAATLGVTPSRLGLLPGLHFGAATIGVVGGGFVARRWGYPRLLRFGAVVLTVGFAVAAIAGSWSILLLGVGLMGLGFGVLVNFNILVDEAFERNGAAALQLINAFFSIGAISAPLLAVLSLNLGGQWFAFGTGGVIAAILVLLLVAGKTDAPAHGTATRQATTRNATATKGLFLPVATFLPLFLIFPGAEASFSNWMPTHLFSLVSLGTASAVTSGFWLMFTAGRLVAVPLSARMTPGALVISAMALGTLATISATVDVLAPSAYLLAGFTLGPIFPGSLSWLRRRYPARAGEVSSIVIGAGGFGGMVLPPLIGLIVERRGAEAVPVALSIVLVAAVAVALAIGISGRLDRTSGAAAAPEA